MKFVEEDILLRIYVNETTKLQGKMLYEVLVMKAKELHLAGATVIRGIMGFGADSHMHTAKILDISMNLPIIVEIVDTNENIQKILPFLDQIVVDGFITMEKVNVIKYRHNR
jgi:PII-like signaling protein